MLASILRVENVTTAKRTGAKTGHANPAEDGVDLPALRPYNSLVKKSVRARMLALRRAYPAEELTARSEALQRRLLEREEWLKARSVALYVSKKEEAGTRLLLDAAWACGKTVFLPRVMAGRPGEMGLAFCPGPGHLRAGPYGLYEPDPASCPWAIFPGRKGLEEGPSLAAPWPELLLVPGLAFDLQGGRLGYGGGYYDRFLAGIEGAVPTVGLAYAFQVLEALPSDPWDLPLGALCTEKEFIDLRSQT